MQLALSKNAASLRKRKHRVLIALFHFVAKVRQFANPRLLTVNEAVSSELYKKKSLELQQLFESSRTLCL